MIYPPVPANEAERLNRLRALRILDTGPERAFDQLTQLACAVLDVPIALVSLVDADRQWFKSRIGLDCQQTARGVSFCAHALGRQGVFYVPDAMRDPRFSDNPLVTDAPNIRFYAGAPLLLPGGYAIGTLCVIDTRPRTLEVGQLRVLRDLADQVQQALQARSPNACAESGGQMCRAGGGAP